MKNFLKFLLAASFLVFVPSCGKEKPEPTFDGNYFRYPEPEYKVLDYGESIVIDFEKELFSDGTMSTYSSKSLSIKDKYDCMKLDAYLRPEFETDINVKQLSPFKFRITNKNTTEFCLQLRPRTYFYNEKTNMRSSAETIYHLYFQPKEEHIVKIKSYDDFFDINPLSSVRLCADIDFQNRGGIKNQLIDTNGDGYFEGCFFNPDHHVIKNWDMDDPRNGWNSIMFSYVQNALFDSLIFENISYRSMNHSKSNFGLIARYSYNSHFNNILVRNLNFEILGGTVGGLVSSSVHDDFTNCDIEGAITNHGDSGQIYCNNQIGALAATQFSIDLDHIYPWTHNDSFRSDFVRLYPYDDYPHEEAIKIQEWEISNYQNKTILKSNHVKVNLENPTYCAGGLFGCSDINAFDDSNTVNGHIKSYHAGKYRGGSSLQWRFFDKGNFKPEPGKTEEINLPE